MYFEFNKSLSNKLTNLFREHFKENLQNFMNKLEIGNGKAYDISITKRNN